MQDKVSIVITCYNYEKYIRECILSCLNQTHQNIEVVIVDDCSTDHSADIIRQRALQDSRIVPVYLKENKGYSHAKNEGIIRSTSEYIALLDADDILVPESIEKRLKVFNERPACELVHGIALRWYGGNDTRGFNPKTYIHAQGRMYRKDVYRKFGLYYEQLRSMSDKEFVYRLGVHPNSPFKPQIKSKKINEVVAWYRKHENQMHRVRKEKTPKLNEKIKKIFKNRIKQLKVEGITRKNTRFYEAENHDYPKTLFFKEY